MIVYRRLTQVRIDSITVRGFRCFDQTGENIHLDNFSCFVGPNASGKTAAMMALVRLFGESNAQRQIIPTDFYLTSGEDLKSNSPRSLLIECRLSFPELNDDDSTSTTAIPETFNQMIVDEPGGTPYCRIRLEATWTDDGTPLGDIAQSISWILTDSDDPKVIEDGNRRTVKPGDRGKIRVIYIPATRDPNQQIKVTTNTNFGRLLNALNLGVASQSLKDELSVLKNQIEKLTGVQTMSKEIQNAWQNFYDGRVAQEVSLQAFEEDPSTLIKLLAPTFRPGEDGCAISTDELSDGMRSLFSLSLSIGLFHIEELLRNTPIKLGFKKEIVDTLPILSIFAVEEPENHLSPHYLGRIVNQLMSTAENENAQVLISSHSPSILRRIQPDYVRYFLGHERAVATRVKSIPLPDDDTDEAFKYVREAVRGYPELYFSRLVILGEGPSEEIVLRRLFEASGTPLDTYFISVVPLGGRHVNHFWRLLHGLDIPFLTLLDLDREKEGAGWGRVQYVRDQLVERFGAGHIALSFKTDNGKIRRLDESTYDNLGQKEDNDTENMDAWLEYFTNTFNVFFSTPLDLDFAMLEAFPSIYKGLAPPPYGPRLPKSSAPNYSDIIKQRMRQVLASDASSALDSLGETYSEDQQKLFSWYKYLFIDGSKPVNHMRALLEIDNEDLMENAPEFLQQIVTQARQMLSTSEEGAECR
jgi:putative ATP-dependent endonuclease of OLD family